MKISISKLKFYYSSSKKKNKIFENLTLEIKDYDFPLRLSGDNGSGKTTLLKLLCGILEPVSGRIIFEPEEIAIGYLPQFPIFLPWKTVKENITFVSKKGCLPEEKIFSYFISQYGALYPNQLSGGNKQILMLLMAVNHLYSYENSQKLFLLDEPFKSLDEKHIKIIKDLLDALTSKMFIIFVSHQKESLINPQKTLRLETNGNGKSQVKFI